MPYKEPKEYIGMRYVPKFAEPLDWNINNTYEALEIVKNGANYYISAQFVPMDIDIHNTEYWILFGNTGEAAAILQLESELDEIRIQLNAIMEYLNK